MLWSWWWKNPGMIITTFVLWRLQLTIKAFFLGIHSTIRITSLSRIFPLPSILSFGLTLNALGGRRCAVATPSVPFYLFSSSFPLSSNLVLRSNDLGFGSSVLWPPPIWSPQIAFWSSGFPIRRRRSSSSALYFSRCALSVVRARFVGLWSWPSATPPRALPTPFVVASLFCSISVMD